MNDPATARDVHGMAPLIRLTLLGLYGALVLPLPWMAPDPWQPILWSAVGLGLILLMAITSEQVILDVDGMELRYPAWCAWWLRRGWQLPWSQVEGLTPVGTSQGGRVFYVRTQGRSYLLPQRVERFEGFLERFSALSGVETESVARLTPPWTYQLLAAMTVALLLGEAVALVRWK